MNYTNTAPEMGIGAGQKAPTPSLNENQVRALGNLDRCHIFAAKIEDVLFSDPRDPVGEQAGMPDAAAWRANLIGNESERLAARLENILNRL